MNRVSDAGKVAAAFHRKAVEYDHHVLVQKRVVAQVAGSVCVHPDRTLGNILDVGTGTGALLKILQPRYPDTRLTGVDIALNMCLQAQLKLGTTCRVVNGDAECLPFKTGVFDLVVSASALQWVRDLDAALREMQRVVRPGGDISLAFFCDGSLAELQHCFRDAVNRGCTDTGQRISRLHRFRTVDEVTSIVNGMGFERFVITVETEVDWYDDVHSLLRSIKNIGAGAVAGGSGSGLGWRGILNETTRLYLERYGQNGRIPASYKVLYLTARTPSESNI